VDKFGNITPPTDCNDVPWDLLARNLHRNISHMKFQFRLKHLSVFLRC
jgi:hypothetical protein